MKLYVGNLPFTATEDEIREAFEPFGGVTDLYIPMDRETGRPRGFAFVTLNSKEQGKEAIETLDGKDFSGRPLRISEAIERERPKTGGGGPGGGGGGGGGGGYSGGGGGNDYGGGGGGGGGGSYGDKRGGGGKSKGSRKGRRSSKRDNDYYG